MVFFVTPYILSGTHSEGQLMTLATNTDIATS